jgi:hypothetical protein
MASDLLRLIGGSQLLVVTALVLALAAVVETTSRHRREPWAPPQVRLAVAERQITLPVCVGAATAARLGWVLMTVATPHQPAVLAHRTHLPSCGRVTTDDYMRVVPLRQEVSWTCLRDAERDGKPAELVLHDDHYTAYYRVLGPYSSETLTDVRQHGTRVITREACPSSITSYRLNFGCTTEQLWPKV